MKRLGLCCTFFSEVSIQNPLIAFIPPLVPHLDRLTGHSLVKSVSWL